MRERSRCAPLVALLLAAACAGAPYVPGLGEIMSSTQMRHLKLWYAGEARNWPLAAYEVDELEEGFADAVRLHPVHDGVPVARLVPEFTAGPIEALRRAVSSQSPQDFASAYDALTAGCNGCHAAAHFSFNVITRPIANPYGDQRFESPR